jgi:ribosome-binding protein aMBF1 (putative translation factor)
VTRFPPCEICGSEGHPADVEVQIRGAVTWLCLFCASFRHQEMAQLNREQLTREKVEMMLALRREPSSKSYRGAD